MRIKPVLGWSAVAATVIFSVGCLEQPAAKKSTAATNSKASGAVIQRGANNQLILAAATTGTPPKTAKITAIPAVHTRQAHEGLEPSHVRGARIYDDFSIELEGNADVTPIAATDLNPLLKAAGKTEPKGPEGYRCSHCHGFDYEGGVYTWNNGATNNLLELKDVRGRSEGDVIDMLFAGFTIVDAGKVVTVHKYSTTLTPQSMVDVADFVVNETFDTHQFIRAPSSGSLGDAVAGTAIFHSPDVPGEIPPIIRMDGKNFNCEQCHGLDGKGDAVISPGTEKLDLNALAWADPFQFLHRTLFGKPRPLTKAITIPYTPADGVMPGLYETVLTGGLHFGGPQQGADVMRHIQDELVP